MIFQDTSNNCNVVELLVISTNDKIISSRCEDGSFPIFVIERRALFQLEINKNNLMCNFYPSIKIYGSRESSDLNIYSESMRRMYTVKKDPFLPSQESVLGRNPFKKTQVVSHRDE